MNTEILKLLESDARLTTEQLSIMLNCDKETVEATVNEYEKNGTILGYNTIVDWEKTDVESVTAMIEVKLTPQRDRGFDRVAEKIYNYPEVKSVYLMSGAYDLNVVVKGKTFHEVTNFVSRELATIDSVTGTATQFVMRRYKEYDVELIGDEADERGKISL